MPTLLRRNLTTASTRPATRRQPSCLLYAQNDGVTAVHRNTKAAFQMRIIVVLLLVVVAVTTAILIVRARRAPSHSADSELAR